MHSPMIFRDASESMAHDREQHMIDKAKFVHNLGLLLSQTREQVTGCTLVDEDTVKIQYKDGERLVNIAMDSYTAIIKDVVSRV